MARGRFISESVAKDARLNSLSVEAELVYLMTIPHLDRDGLIEGDPDVLWGRVCPKRRQFLDNMAAYIKEWAKAELVLMYDSSDGPVLWFKGFTKNQQGMRYERESPSKFPPPPSGSPPANIPTNSGTMPDEIPYKVEVKDQDQEGDRVRAQESVQAAPELPPPSMSPALNGNGYQAHPYRASIAPGEYIPGVRRPQWNQAKRNADQFTAQAAKHGIGAEPFRLMVDAVLDATGKMALAGTNCDLGQQVLNQAKETVVTLLEMKRCSLEDVQDVLRSWRENDWRGHSPPTFAQIVEHASAMDAGTHRTARKQDSGKKEFASLADYNEWAARNDPDYKRIREGILVKGTFVRRESYQPTLVH